MEGVNCLKLLLDGDREGLGCLYKLFSEDLFKYGFAICNNEDVVSECMHDFFVFLWEKREKLTNINHPRAYLFTSFKRRLFRTLSKNKKYTDIQNERAITDREESIEMKWIIQESENEYTSKLNRALLQLSEREREVIQLKYYESFTNEEIAEILEINYQSTRNLLYRAIQNLRKKL